MPIVLIIIAVLLITFNIKAIKNEDKKFKDVLDEKERSMTPSDIAIGEIRKDVAESLLEIQQDIELLKHSVIKYDKEQDKENDKEEENKEEENEEKIDENNKVTAVIKLLSIGKDVDEISTELNLGKGEVLLIKELYKK
ncbi:DUF6115 domain-containing protein [Clostridium algidicarnis]|uniref:Uncharacterized protein n=1 Tax=Clostridium algidicarnis DSM 15099 TaxID=1121295 RepID=A0A2S6G147_9CLOT|nr:hypothetical protein [Clostridium algidicarnis]MCB2286523.1 hypothetical protein [Clostridium algidicarnis]PPK49520.1 hypothetical protein BD821_101181 [Clostridium algidicarnis DSM 15099]